MAESRNHRFQKLLQQLFAAIQNGDTTALAKTLSLLKKNPGEPNLLHLAGLACMQKQDYKPATDYLKRSLKNNPQQPEVHNNLANAYKALASIKEAERHYRTALKLQPQYREAWKNLGLLLFSEQRYEDAEVSLQHALALKTSDSSILTSLGNLHKEQQQFEKAIHYYNQALAIDANYVNAIHNLGLCYKLQEKPDQAIVCYKRAQTLAPQLAEIDFNYANALFELGQQKQAEALYLSAIDKNPHFTLAHETLSEFYWQSGQLDKIENSYRKAIHSSPSHIGLRLSFINVLINAGRHDMARTVIEDSLQIKMTTGLLQAQGKLFANELNYPEAQSSFEKALSRSFKLDIAQDLIRLHIVQGNYPHALKLLTRAQERRPDDQLNWALKSLCWRLLEDARYHWLNDYQDYVRGYTLPTPKGYSSLAEFLEELKIVLLGMHNARLEPSRQTLKHGTQTPGRLLHKPDPVIQRYKASLKEAVQAYVSALPEDKRHPLLGRKKDHFQFSGSWSVKLKSTGFHINHIHPDGWISSACYISIPENMSTVNGNQGCIKFGESALGLGEREVIERIIRPEAGQLVLFPSYTWHGTFDFECETNDYRLTAPFDVIPH